MSSKTKDEAENARDVIAIPGLPQLCQSDLPSFLQPSNTYASLLRFVLNQFSTVSQATWILGNSFNELEMAEIQSMDSLIPIRTVGPLVPSAFLDGNNPDDQDVGTHLWKATNCIDWLNKKEAATVVYVSFGSLAVLSKEKIIEIALGLKASQHSFLWVIRPDHNKEEEKDIHDFLEGFIEETMDQGLVVSWCPQMAVLNLCSVGMFVTHSGWNSMLESLSSGLPVLTISQWSDQMTNSKYIEEVWKTGIRLNKTRDGPVGRDEMEKSIRTIMEGESGLDLRKNALQWKTLAKKAMVKGGSSDKSIDWFVHEVIARTTLA
ncbi:UDP-glycosyltransferase 74E2-like [Cryptomeria japonica]|uniref:UDP-glycosyltransferase 74E2-like n=1 Tax=Cryptomeria japonica TaxID=3369 RepID=UPI0027D9D620|nr:UDP-glycosyltransferase 74E2-like [Cryptomeria japonica]